MKKLSFLIKWSQRYLPQGAAGNINKAIQNLGTLLLLVFLDKNDSSAKFRVAADVSERLFSMCMGGRRHEGQDRREGQTLKIVLKMRKERALMARAKPECNAVKK